MRVTLNPTALFLSSNRSISFSSSFSAPGFAYNNYPSPSSPLASFPPDFHTNPELLALGVPPSTQQPGSNKGKGKQVDTQHTAEGGEVIKKPKRVLRAKKAAITMTPAAVAHLRTLSPFASSAPASAEQTLLRIGIRTKGCAGMAYHLEYVNAPGKFDEVVEQDGVKVLIDSKALMSILGSEMDWVEDRLSAKFVFHNPNIVDACGCGESFNVAASS
ncbi:iron sulfur assembly protein 1 [Phaffia rhodozyma]|uniref:Iron-sulfur assembly protein 1 n=1 Tax=Phaffia rhodozyma TaxID=264483 RepID=A0A0F7SFK0_PHARH|nr:iron sulfur assembly protein 1 [Phaffia rhodozyma]